LDSDAESPTLEMRPEKNTIFEMTNRDLDSVENSILHRRSASGDQNSVSQFLSGSKLPEITMRKKKKSRSPRKKEPSPEELNWESKSQIHNTTLDTLLSLY